MEKDELLANLDDFEVIDRNGKQHLLFSSPAIAEDLKKLNVYPIGLGVEPSDKKNLTLKRSPFVLGELATLYLSAK